MLPGVGDLRVLIVADDPLVRAGLATLLDGQAGCAVVGQVAGEVTLLDEWAVFNPDVVAWDLGWEPADGPAAGLADLEEAAPPVVALLPDETYAPDAWAAGVRGLLLRDAEPERLVAALVAVARGLVALDPTLAAELLPAGSLPPASPADDLTPRELEVLQLLAEGLSNKAIALRLGISQHTVKFHVNAILGKLGAQSRTDAVVRATRLGLIIL